MINTKSNNLTSATPIFPFWGLIKLDFRQKTPLCPKCSSPMVIREPKRGPNKGKKFYGCSNYPECKDIISILAKQLRE